MTKDEIRKRVDELHEAWQDGQEVHGQRILADLLYELQNPHPLPNLNPPAMKPPTRGEEIAEKIVSWTSDKSGLGYMCIELPDETCAELRCTSEGLDDTRAAVAAYIDAARAEMKAACAKAAEDWQESPDVQGDADGCLIAYNEGQNCTAPDGIAATIRAMK